MSNKRRYAGRSEGVEVDKFPSMTDHDLVAAAREELEAECPDRRCFRELMNRFEFEVRPPAVECILCHQMYSSSEGHPDHPICDICVRRASGAGQ